jgi:hypothetical protein
MPTDATDDTDLPDALVEALDFLLPPEERSGDLTADLAEAAKATMRRREENSLHGGVILAALHGRLHSWRRLERLTGIPSRTARRWAGPPDYPTDDTDD